MGLLDKMVSATEKKGEKLFEKFTLENEFLVYSYGMFAITNKKIMSLDSGEFKFIPIKKVTMVEYSMKGTITIHAGSSKTDFKVTPQIVENVALKILDLIQ